MKRITPLLLLLGLSVATMAGTPQPFLIKKIITSSEDTIHSILWEISSPQSKHRSYLFGTHHAFGKHFFDSLHIAKQKLLSSDILLKENINIPGRSAADIINKRSKHTKWPRFLNKNSQQYVEALFAKSETDYRKLSPAELHAFLGRYYRENVCGAKQPSDSFLTLDDYIEQLAAAQNIQLLGFETLEEQIKLINQDVKGMPAKVHKKRLDRLVERLQNNNREECGEVAWYRNMEMDYQLDRVCRNSLILSDRNDKWLLEMEPYLKTQNCFIAVGLSHLMFECGLINQLRELGYQVRPIPVK